MGNLEYAFMNNTSRVNNDTKSDGRRLRSVRSREMIKTAIHDLIYSGNYSPRATDIAQKTELSIRTVFRNIDDMDSLTREIASDLENQVLPIYLKPYKTTTWREQLDELVQNRCEIYEKIFPVRVSLSLRRFRSEYLKSVYERVFEMEKASLQTILPKSIREDDITFAALNTLISSLTWINLRLDQRYNAQKSQNILQHQVNCLVKQFE
jgi:HEPN domain-containing protein